MLDVDWYDDVRLKDGRKGCDNSETVTVAIDDIAEVIRKN